jgi:C-terminal processing protease CtpA/Prc
LYAIEGYIVPKKEDNIGARGRLEKAAGALRGRSASVMKLATFLAASEKKHRLSRKDRLRIVEQALLVLNMNYVHLPLKRAMHAIDPIQRLKLLRFRLLEMKESEMPSEITFHKRMMEVFASTRDLHTLYLLPVPFSDRVAYLPFLIEQCFEINEIGERVEKFMISRVVEEFFKARPKSAPEVANFQPGVEVLYWNGVPIKRAIELNGETQAGSNIEARFARGLDNLTIRPLESSLPPDESWVSLTYRSQSGEVMTLTQEWLVYKMSDDDAEPVSSQSTRKKRAAIDIKKTKINHLKRTMFAPRNLNVPKSFENTFYAQIRRIEGRDFGYIRLFSFDVDEPDEFVDEVVRVITSDEFPQEGLILDVRGNGGGKIRAGERLLQLFTPHRISPERFEFINTPLNLEICRLAPDEWGLSQWAASIAEAVVTGATYSSGFPVNSERSCNNIGQIYYGPVLLITDALSYSTTDIFAAGFQDNEVGEILGTSDNTGAGGANVWWYQDLVTAVGKSPNSPFKPLPRGADMLVAMRRSIRVRKHAGRPLEELGITPDHRHYMTKRDVLESNQDLAAQAGRLLRSKPVYSLSVRMFERNGSRVVTVSALSKTPASNATSMIARVDVYRDGRPFKSFDATNGSIRPRTIHLGKSLTRKAEVRIEAYDGHGNLVAARRLDG